MPSNVNAGFGAGLVHKQEFPRETHQFTWKIGDFDQIRKSEEMVEASRVNFSMGRSIRLPITLQAYLILKKKSSRSDKDRFSVGFNVVDSPKDAKQVMAMVKIRIGQDYADRQFACVQNLLQKKDFKLEIIPQFETNSYEGYFQKRLPLDKEGCLPIDIEVTLYKLEQSPVISISELVVQFQGKFFQKLSQDRGKLRKEPISSAGAPNVIRMISKDGKQFSVNWWIMAERSPVFRTMFQTPMSEVNYGIVNTDDIGGEALDVILEFIHTATLKDTWHQPGILEEVICAAHRYEIVDLLEFLEKTMEPLFTTKNCAQLLQISNILGLKEAQSKLQDNWWKQAKGPEDLMQLLDNLQCNTVLETIRVEVNFDVIFWFCIIIIIWSGVLRKILM